MSVFSDIVAVIDAGIDAMTTGGGYNYNYDNVNQQKPASKTYPNVITKYNPFESDEPDQPAGSYSGNFTALFVVTVDDTVANTQTYLSNVFEDFQRLFTAIEASLQAVGVCYIELLREEKFYTHVRARPGYIEMEWFFKVRVSRANPANSI